MFAVLLWELAAITSALVPSLLLSVEEWVSRRRSAEVKTHTYVEIYIEGNGRPVAVVVAVLAAVVVVVVVPNDYLGMGTLTW